MALKHLTRVPLRNASGRVEDVHVNDDGHEIHALSGFARHLDTRGHSDTTKKRYQEAAARFVDYLIECEVFGRPAMPDRIADAMTAYPILLRDGAAYGGSDFPGLATYATEIGMPDGIAANSFLPTLAGVNHFLRFAQQAALRGLAGLADERIRLDYLDLRVTFAAIDGVEKWSAYEKERFRQQAVMGGVVRVSDRLERPRRLRAPVHGGVQADLERKEFPLLRIPELLDQARSSRDRALWALLAAGGIRLHEALQLTISDFDASTGELWVIDPNNERFGRDMSDADRVRFKGRTMSRVYLYEPLASIFWEALGDYTTKEFVPSAEGEADFLFKKRDSTGRGQPLYQASDTALEKPFKAAVIRAGIPGPPEAPGHVWTLHSLRHSYGVYMLNHIPVPGGPGLRLTEVQMLMGHARVESTAVYARHDRLLVEAKLEAANQTVYDGTASAKAALDRLPKSIAARLRRAADELEHGKPEGPRTGLVARGR